MARDSTDARVAVILTCCNEGPYIGAAVRSVLAQTCGNLIESIIVADDGSDAPTVEILRDIETWDPRIRVVFGTGGAGQSAQRNLAVSLSQAPVLAFLDGDDIWTPDKLERQLPALVTNAAIGLIYSGYFAFVGDDITGAHQAMVRDITGQADLTRGYFLTDPPIVPSTILVRRTAFDACGGFDPEIRVFEDTDFCLRLSRVCRFKFIEAPVLYKRTRSASITTSRKDLMAHHAFVALKAAAHEPRLMALVPRRLAERARKLGNHNFMLGNAAEARHLLRFATSLDPLNVRAWFSLIVAGYLNRPAYRLVMASRLRSRRLALGNMDS